MKRSQAGFTLLELVVAMALLATMMLLLYSGLNFGIRSWDAGDVNGRRTADRRIGENFLRREIAELFPMRWKEPNVVKFAFEGERDRMRFVSSRPAGLSQGGLSLVGLEVQDEGGGSRRRNLVMRRAMPDDEQKSFDPLDKAEPTLMLAGVQSVSFEYFGSENDFTPPQWTDTWKPANRIPEAIRLHIVADDGPLPDMSVRISLGEEAGCLENAFQRNCRPRRQ
jgi:general secretion pathway protein J